MTLALGILGSLGGVLALLSLIFVIGRGIFKQISATEENTQVLNSLSNEVNLLKEQISKLDTRLSVVEDRVKRNSRGST